MPILDPRITEFDIGELEKDFPEQFKGRFNIGKLAAAFDEQLKEVSSVIEDLYRYGTLDGGYPLAPGEDWNNEYEDEQLDLAGDNVVLSRADAGVVSSPNMSQTAEAIMANGEYSRYLHYKAYKNSSECTYYDLMTMLGIITDNTSIGYLEDPLYPATIVLTPSDWSTELPPVAPAGVGIKIRRLRNDNLNMHLALGNVIKESLNFEFDATTENN